MTEFCNELNRELKRNFEPQCPLVKVLAVRYEKRGECQSVRYPGRHCIWYKKYGIDGQLLDGDEMYWVKYDKNRDRAHEVPTDRINGITKVRLLYFIRDFIAPMILISGQSQGRLDSFTYHHQSQELTLVVRGSNDENAKKVFSGQQCADMIGVIKQGRWSALSQALGLTEAHDVVPSSSSSSSLPFFNTQPEQVVVIDLY